MAHLLRTKAIDVNPRGVYTGVANVDLLPGKRDGVC